ncbi:hypothetical protein, partial [Endozoicomonas sp. ONNA1]|uniref:hypothetical protein n=1 Tax=Endozoicomonas sp. ONNA1 TaxID=2828740 RepID=UPI002147ACE8
MRDFRVPKNMHVSIVDPIEGWEFGCLTIWAKVNPDYVLHVWAPERLAYKKILYSLLMSEINKNAIEKDSPDDDIAKLKDRTWKIIDDFMGKSPNVEQLNIMSSSFSDNVKQSFAIQWDKTSELLNKIETSIVDAVVHRDEIDFKPIEIQYIKYSLGFTDSLITERFIGIYHAFNFGGAYIDKGLLPEMESKAFLKRSSSGESISEIGVSDENKKRLERAKIRALFEKMFSDGMIPDPSPYFETYDTNLPEEQTSQIKDIVKKTSIGDLFQRLGEYQLTHHTRNTLMFGMKINSLGNFVDSTLDHANQPFILLTLKRNPLIKISLDEITFLHDAVEGLKKSAISEEELIPKIKEKLRQFYQINKTDVSSSNINEVAMMSAKFSYHNKETDQRIINKIGYNAFERLKNTQLKRKYKIIPFVKFSANNPFYNRRSYVLSFNPSLIVRERPYDKLIIINLFDSLYDKERSLTESINLYHEYRTEKSVLYNVVEINMPQGKTLKLEIVKGIPFTNIGEDTKVIITGEVYFSDIRRATRFFSDTQNLIKKLTLVLSMAIPSNTTVQTIAFSFDNSAQGIFGSSGVLGVLNVNHKGYAVPEVLRELAKKGIFANAAVAVRTPHSADDPDIPSTSSNAPYPEPNRVVFTLLPDGTTVEYRTRFGLASLEPKNVFTHALPESHHSDNGTEGQSNDASSEDDPIKAILQEKIAGSG